MGEFLAQQNLEDEPTVIQNDPPLMLEQPLEQQALGAPNVVTHTLDNGEVKQAETLQEAIDLGCTALAAMFQKNPAMAQRMWDRTQKSQSEARVHTENPVEKPKTENKEKTSGEPRTTFAKPDKVMPLIPKPREETQLPPTPVSAVTEPTTPILHEQIRDNVEVVTIRTELPQIAPREIPLQTEVKTEDRQPLAPPVRIEIDSVHNKDILEEVLGINHPTQALPESIGSVALALPIPKTEYSIQPISIQETTPTIHISPEDPRAIQLRHEDADNSAPELVLDSPTEQPEPFSEQAFSQEVSDLYELLAELEHNAEAPDIRTDTIPEDDVPLSIEPLFEHIADTSEELDNVSEADSTPPALKELFDFLEQPVQVAETFVEEKAESLAPARDQPLEVSLLQIAQIMRAPVPEATYDETWSGGAEQPTASSAEAEIRVELQSALNELHVVIQESATKQEIGDEEVPAITPEITEKMLAVLKVIGYEEPAKALVAFAETYGIHNLVKVFQQISLLIYDADHKEVLSTRALASLSATVDDSRHRIGSALLWLVRRLQPSGDMALTPATDS